MPFFDYDNVHFYFESIGEGQPLVMCHGLTGDLTAPKQLLGELPGLRLVLLDARAHGKTEPLGPPSKLGFKQFSADLHALVEHLEIDNVIVGGISMGAGIATRFAIDFPRSVTGLILIRPAWRDTSSPTNLNWCPLLAELFDQHGLEGFQKAFNVDPIFRELKDLDPPLYQSFQDEFSTQQAIERRARLTAIPRDCPICSWQEVESLNVPSIVIGSANDRLHPYSCAEAWAAHLFQSRLEIVATKSTDLHQHIHEVRQHVCSYLNI